MRRLLNLSYPELDFLVDWYEKRKIKRSLVRRPPITPSSKKTKFQDTPTLSPEIQAKTARACRYEPEEDQYASSQTLSSSLVYEHDPMDHATATNFQEMWNEYMNDHRSASPQTPSREDGAGLDFVTLEHTDTVGDLEMANHEGPETSAERADVFFDGTVASTEGAAENLAALTYIELLLHKREVENITESVRIGNITQSQLVKALEAVSDGLYGLAMKYDVGFESGQASLVGGPEQQTD
ncbi:uncharacterized protein BT62DRAFT_757210 [Guyanagaster necrorhizus]|uniref:Uncharacterized protein n=1 Tax=Guyanagaster necrorhizus TaxID=856835 RepID=A0A9P7VXS7_9AGAR|nr:uncharacterized protein BT62DRAFT_757210 [Guyanagaster necrorhizus MCA 3950]KAG7448169.1 hypothetical protein BT62DRAFT_757210 [Guyanagaster necrorhizus MCA 3950]